MQPPPQPLASPIRSLRKMTRNCFSSRRLIHHRCKSPRQIRTRAVPWWRDGAYWLLAPPAVPGNLLDGYTSEGRTKFTSDSYAAFGEATWHATDRLDATLGVRYTYEDKSGTFASVVYGGPPGLSQTLINRQLSILRPQAYDASVSEGNFSGRANISYKVTQDVMVYGIYAQGYKSGGINMSGLPLNASNLPALNTAVIKPEKNTTIEAGVKTELLDHRLILNADAFLTTVRNFQTNIVDSAPGALRGYLSNAEKARVQGIELDSTFIVSENLSGNLSAAFMDGKYVSYNNGSCPLELIATSTTVCDLSGRPLSALPKWTLSAGGEYVRDANFAGLNGNFFVNVEGNLRTKVFGDSSDSKYTVIDGYGVVNLALGFRQEGPWEVFL